jgi:hypothetical protein
MIDLVFQVQGLKWWPAELGDFKLMGPVNKLGSRRWYEKYVTFKGRKYVQRVQINSRLVPLWETLTTKEVD